MTGSPALVAVRGVTKHYPVTGGVLNRVVNQVRAVDDVSFDISEGETMGVVGESGCGKTTVGMLVLQLVTATAGTVLFQGHELTAMSKRQLRPIRRQMQMIFQDPFSSLNSRFSVGDILAEPLVIHRVGNRHEQAQRVRELLEMVGLDASDAERYPHEFSGGQRQRIAIARALALEPRLIVCDEPVSALDVSIQAQILNLLTRLRDTMGLTYLFIAHNLGVIRQISERVGVMYLGKMVEMARTDDIFGETLHPYTRALLSAVPRPDPTLGKERIILRGDVPSPLDPPPGCRFHTRCPSALEACREQEPVWQEAASGHWVACLLFEEGRSGGL